MSENQEKKKDQKESKYSGLDKFAKYSGLGFQMLAIILVSVWGGQKLDEKYHDGEPLFIIILSVVGVFVALYSALKDFINFKK